MSSSSHLSCTFLVPTSRSFAFRNSTGCHWLKLVCTSARTAGVLPRRWDCPRTRCGTEWEAHTFSALPFLARQSHTARDDSGPDHGYHLSASLHRQKPRPSFRQVLCEFGSAVAATSQRPRRQCQVLMQWKLKAMEAVAVGGRVVPRLHTHATFPRAGEHLVPQTRPGPLDHGRTVPTSRHSALAVVPEIVKNRNKPQSFLDRWC